MRKAVQRLKNERGLTLVELLAVIVILAIVAVIAFVFIGGIIENSKKDAHIANAQQAIAAAKLHEATGGEKEVTDGITIKKLQELDYLDKPILDPWTKEEYTNLEQGKVTKDTNGYKISFEGSGCKITNKSETDLSTKTRDEICE